MTAPSNGNLRCKHLANRVPHMSPRQFPVIFLGPFLALANTPHVKRRIFNAFRQIAMTRCRCDGNEMIPLLPQQIRSVDGVRHVASPVPSHSMRAGCTGCRYRDIAFATFRFRTCEMPYRQALHRHISVAQIFIERNRYRHSIA